MNAEKAREYFSSYFEGSLDTGLCQTFERKLQTDAELQVEYRAFERTMGELSSLREVDAELPFDLHDKIQARLDLHIFEQKRSKKAPFALWFRTLGIAGLAALAIFGTIKAIGTDKPVNGPTEAGFGFTGGEPPKVETEKGFRLQLKQFSTSERAVTITDATTGENRGNPKISPETPYVSLDNSGTEPVLVKVEIAGENRPIYVAVPTKQAWKPVADDATLRGAALRLAQKNGKPVVLMVQDPASALPVASGSNANTVDGLTKTLGEGYMIEERAGGFIWVQQH